MKCIHSNTLLPYTTNPTNHCTQTITQTQHMPNNGKHVCNTKQHINTTMISKHEQHTQFTSYAYHISINSTKQSLTISTLTYLCSSIHVSFVFVNQTLNYFDVTIQHSIHESSPAIQLTHNWSLMSPSTEYHNRTT